MIRLDTPISNPKGPHHGVAYASTPSGFTVGYVNLSRVSKDKPEMLVQHQQKNSIADEYVYC